MLQRLKIIAREKLELEGFLEILKQTYTADEEFKAQGGIATGPRACSSFIAELG